MALSEEASLHYLFSFNSNCRGWIQKRFSETYFSWGSTNICYLLFSPVICYHGKAGAFQSAFPETLLCAPFSNQTLFTLYTKSCQHSRWRKRIRGSCYRNIIWHDTERKPRSHLGTSGFLLNDPSGAEQEFCHFLGAFPQLYRLHWFSSYRELFLHLI